MRLSLLPLAASVALLAAPAFAQTTGTTPGTTPARPDVTAPSASRPAHVPPPGMTESHAAAAAETPPSNMSNNNNNMSNMQVTRNTQQKLERSLEQSGFHDVSVTPRTFIIHAQAPDGSHIVMVVGPDMAHGVVMSGTSSAPSGSMQNNSSAWSRGGTNR